MRHLLFSLALVVCFFASSAHKMYEPSETAKKENSDARISTFSRHEGQTISGLSVGHAFDVTIKQGSKTGVQLEIDSRMAEYLVCDLSGGHLRLGFRDLPRELQQSNWWKTNPKATITVSSLDRLEVNGAAQVHPEGSFKSKNTMIDLSGASKVGSLTLSSTGNSRIKCSGASQLNGLNLTSTENCKIEASGASHLRDLQLKGMIDCAADVSGASHVSVNGQWANFNGEASGASRLTASGSADVANISVSGAAHASCEGMETNRVKAWASGSGSVRCWANNRIDATASGSGSVRYKGNPSHVNKNASRGSSIASL